jgi:hypothetical protein
MRVVSVTPTAAVDGRRRREVFGDPYIRTPAEIALEPRRVVVELTPDEFQAINKAAGRDSPADYLRAIALRELSG